MINKTPVETPRKTQEYLLCSAFEGGSNYWYRIEGYDYPKGKSRKDFEFPHIEVPFAGGVIRVKDMEGGSKRVYRLNLKTLDRGWKLMHDKYPHHYADAITGQDDATTGDVFLQCCLFGDVIYG